MRRRVVCASSVLFGEEAFAHFGKTVFLAPRDITNSIVSAADALITRSKTRCDHRLLGGTRVQFVGTATAGYDHLDTNYLEHRGIAWTHAPGCNARSVSEYVMTALLCLAERHSLSLDSLTMGVIGVGQIGSRVASAAEALGMKVLRNDPPLQAETGDPGYVSLEDILRHADIVTLHVPLSDAGLYATRHMVDHRFFARLKPGCIFINTSRGEVVDSEALLLAMDSDVVAHAVLDVWEKEPYVSPRLLERVDLGTSHIAGYSADGKLAGTMAVYQEACHFFEVSPEWQPPDLPAPPTPHLEVDARGRRDEEVLYQLVRSVYDIEKDDRDLRQTAGQSDNARAAGFVRLRMEYPTRREFASVQVTLSHPGPALMSRAAGLGFHVVS